MLIGVKLRNPRTWVHTNFGQELSKRLNAAFYGLNEIINPQTELLVTNDISEAELAKLPKLIAVICPTSGREGIPINELRSRGIAVYINADQVGQCVAAYAEHHILAFMRHEKPNFLDGKKIIILGYGNVGSRVFKKLAAHGGEYIIVRRDIDAPPVAPFCQYANLSNMLPAVSAADLMVNALPFNEETRGVLKNNVPYRSSAVIVSLSRPGIIDEYAVAQSVLNGSLSAAVLDVYPQELDSLRNQHSRLVLTGHTAGIWGKGVSHLENFVLESIHSVFQT